MPGPGIYDLRDSVVASRLKFVGMVVGLAVGMMSLAGSGYVIVRYLVRQEAVPQSISIDRLRDQMRGLSDQMHTLNEKTDHMDAQIARLYCEFAGRSRMDRDCDPRP